MSTVVSLEDCDDCVEPADAFALIGDEIRLSILEALWRLETPARFSDVRQAADVADSAHFNYHLGKLRGTFVRKADSGYELRTAGQRVVQAVLAGSFTEHPEREIAIDDECTLCGGALAARYADELLSIECEDCGHRHGEYPFPPGGFHDRTDAEVLEAFDQRVRHLHCLAKDGVCPECNGRMETEVVQDDGCCLGVGLRVDHHCQQCGHTVCSAIGLGLLDHSRVASFYEDHGVSLSDTPYWQLRWCVDDAPVTVLEEDPWRFRVEMTLDGETLRVEVDGDLAVVGSTRVHADAA
ncbi:MAG: ArsR family transcriptional regulator [Halobacteriales archaeon]|nr:ArsR family transcriptional regulator [Halobacteriales archaeon]